MIDGDVFFRHSFLDSMSSKLHERLVRVVERLSIELQAHVKQNKLSGQVLKNRTGTLRRSINRRVTVTPTSVQASVGTNVKYAKVHEYGFKGTVQVREHLRMIKQAWGRPIEEREVSVRAHARKVDLPARSFLRSALRDKRAQIVFQLSEAKRGLK